MEDLFLQTVIFYEAMKYFHNYDGNFVSPIFVVRQSGMVSGVPQSRELFNSSRPVYSLYINLCNLVCSFPIFSVFENLF